MILNKLYLALGIAAVVGAAWLRYDYVVKDRDELKTKLATSQAELTKANETIELDRQERIAANETRSEYLAQLESAKNETKRLQTCIDNKSCVATIRVRVPTSCPTADAGGAAGAATAEAELDGAAVRAYNNLRDGIARTESDLALCIATVKRWSDEKSPTD
jgi:hypothetical protein